jgi:serine/threonine-protein kinase RsbW
MSYRADAAASVPIGPDESAVVQLTIPCAPVYVGTARLTILGVASRMGFSYDQVEDIRLAVGEACANAIERSGYRTGVSAKSSITIRSFVDPARLIVEIDDHLVAAPGDSSVANVDLNGPASEIDGMDNQELGALLMEILVDEVAIEQLEEGGVRVRLTKYANES